MAKSPRVVGVVDVFTAEKSRQPLPIAQTPEPVTPRSQWLSASQALAIPFGLAVLLFGFGIIEPVRQNPRLFWSVLVTALALLIWDVALLGRAVRAHRAFTLTIVLRKQHYLQACAQASVLLYWGWHWRDVYDSAYLIAAQLVFAYAFDMLLSWSRRDDYTLGFAPFPVIFSINLFLWFKPDWFHLQFIMVAVGFAAKELIRWDKEGRRAHIFNPSSFPLAIFSLALIITGMSETTVGKEIAITQFFPPHMYLFLFLIGLPGQYLFGVTTMTMSAALTTYVFGLLYFAATGTYYFFDSYIPIAVFLGMHLLFTDPSTSPRTELGRIMFGMAYGLSTVLLYFLLGVAGLPTFYDKLLQVPILNLSIKSFDRVARSQWLRVVDPASLGRALAPRQRNLAYMFVWAITFGVMSATEGVGDKHPGQWLPFWRQACSEDRPYACGYLALMESRFCDAGSAWACNEFGILQTMLDVAGPGPIESLDAGCNLGFATACANRERIRSGSTALVSAAPTLEDYPILLRGSKGPITEQTAASMFGRACDQGWPEACGQIDQSRVQP